MLKLHYKFSGRYDNIMFRLGVADKLGNSDLFKNSIKSLKFI